MPKCKLVIKFKFLLIIIFMLFNNNCFAIVGTPTNAMASPSFPSSSGGYEETTSHILNEGSGYYAFDGTATSYQASFYTCSTVKCFFCPSGYSPYIQLEPVMTWGPDPASCFTLVVSTNPAPAYAWDPAGAYQGTYLVYVNRTYGSDSGGVAFTWTLYCYPPGVPAPAYMPSSPTGC